MAMITNGYINSVWHTGTSSTTSATITTASNPYYAQYYDMQLAQWSHPLLRSQPTPQPQPQPMKRKSSDMEWLDERVNSMRVRL